VHANWFGRSSVRILQCKIIHIQPRWKQLKSGLLTILLKSIAITMEYFASKSIADTDSDTFYKKPFDTLPILIRYFLTILSNFRTVYNII
jgi:hypothetical protein